MSAAPKLSDFEPHVQEKLRHVMGKSDVKLTLAKADTRNKTEVAFAAHLELRRQLGLYTWVSDHEAFTLKLARRTHYRIDFAAQTNEGVVELYDTKGTTKDDRPYIRDKAKLKLKLIAKLYPCFPVFVAWRVNGSWKLERIHG